MKKYFLLGIFFCITSVVWSQTVIDGIAYRLDTTNKTAKVVFHDEWWGMSSGQYTGDVIIPSSITYDNVQYSVTSIGTEAFALSKGLTSVSIPNSIVTIGDYAFSSCTGLISITIPNSVTSIGAEAFNNCSSLTSVSIGESLESIYINMFKGCTSLTAITIPDNVKSISLGAFQGCSNLKTAIIGDGVTYIGNEVFEGCINLERVYLGKSLKEIFFSFEGCTNLRTLEYNCESCNSYDWFPNIENLIIGENVSSLYSSFTAPNLMSIIVEKGNPIYDSRNHCNAIIETSTNTLISGCMNTTIPNSVTSIGKYAFHNRSGLTSISIPNSVTSIGDDAFSRCSELTSISIPNSITSIGDGAFWGCTGLTSVTINSNAVLSKASSSSSLKDIFGNQVTTYTIGNEVTSVGDYAFSDCTGLTSVTIGNNVKSIGKDAFAYCSGLTSITIPNSVTSLGYSAFNGCSRLTSITIPNSVKSLGSAAFYNCSGLTSVTIGNNVTSIESATFYNCSGLTSVTIPNSVTTIGKNAFSGCSGLTSISIPNSVTSIGEQAFKHCQSLTTITIPNSVTTIGRDAFYGCSNLTMVDLHCKEIGTTWFQYNKYINNLIVGDEVMIINNYAFMDCSGLTTVSIGNNVKSIGSSAFSGCSNLTYLICYAMTPPTVGRDVFSGVPEGLVVYVPAIAIPLYQEAKGWKDLTLRIQDDNCNISVSLPTGCNPKDFAQMWLELTNTKSGQRMHYVMTDRTTYTFQSIIRNTTWNVVLRNEHGDVFGKIDNVEVKDEDVAVAFASLTKPQNISLSVLTPNGEDVTEQTQITWTDTDGNYVAQGASLSGLPVGYRTKCRVALPQELSMMYDAPRETEYVLKEGGNDISCRLEAIPQVHISGKVRDATTGQPLNGTVVSASQTFGEKYTKTVNAKTGRDGLYSFDISNVPTTMAFAATDYVSQTVDCGELMTGKATVELADVSLKVITGATITVGFTYTEAKASGEEAETQSWYSDYNNLSYELFNVTKNHAITQFNVQFPQIVLLEDVENGDLLRLTATSLKDAFIPVVSTVTIAEQKATATFDIKELGKIHASYAKTGNTAVVSSLYDEKGKLVKTYKYSNASLTISNLTDGTYKLLTMGSSQFFNTIYNFAQLPETGLDEGKDYVVNEVEVRSGIVSKVNIAEVPVLNESKLYYTGENTSFTVNKPSIVVGNYLTLISNIDFKSAYASGVSNVQLVVDLPESCSFVENSVMVGSSTSSYMLNGSQLTIPMVSYSDRVRFCVIPTACGNFEPSAFVLFDYDGEQILQPIGNAESSVEDMRFNVPPMTSTPNITVSGTSLPNSVINIYDGNILVGTTKANKGGIWSVGCNLNRPYNLTYHSIHVKATTDTGIETSSLTKECLYDKDYNQISTVTMIVAGGKGPTVTFDFKKKEVRPKYYQFTTGSNPFTCTYLIDFENNSPEKLAYVKLHVYLGNRKHRVLYPEYNSEKNVWVIDDDYDISNYPNNVDVEYVSVSVSEPDTLQAHEFAKEYEMAVEDQQKEFERMDSLQELIDKELAKEVIDEQIVDSYLTELGKLYNLSNEKYAQVDSLANVLVDSLISAKTDEEFLLILTNIERGTYSGDGPNSLVDDYQVIDLGQTITPPTNSGRTIVNATYLPTSSSSGSVEQIISHPEAWTIENDMEECSSSFRMRNTMTGERCEMNSRSILFPDGSTEQMREFDNNMVDLFNDVIGSGSRILEERLNTHVQKLEIKYLEAEITHDLMVRRKLTSSISDVRLEMSREKALRASRALRNSQRLLNASRIVGNISSGIGVASDIGSGWPRCRAWDQLIAQAEELCDEEEGQRIANRARDYKGRFSRRYGAKIFGSLVTEVGENLGISASAGTMGTSLAITGACRGVNALLNHWQNCYNSDNERWMAEIRKMIFASTKCRPLPEDDREPPIAPVQAHIDPSGYVYEGVSSNRLQGVTATVFYKEEIEDMYGDLHENIVKWDAENYAQENPLFTDEYGMYRWDVPQGLWQVKLEKEGYETTYSEWLPVPPPQLEVNIAMRQNRQPEVRIAHAYENAVEVEFDKYMMPDLLTTENITVMQAGTLVEGTVELLNEEVAYEGETHTFASKVRFNAVKPFTEKEVTLMVSNRVRSYADIRMQDNFSQTFTVEQEIKEIACDSVVFIDYGEKAALIVTVLPASGSKGKMLTVKTSSPMILSVDNERVVIGDDGKAEIVVSGELPGTAALTFSVEGTDKTAITVANVVMKTHRIVATPTASVISGTEVDFGTGITLSCSTEGATIYYTLDGSCPCDDTASRMVYDGTPIIITGNITIKMVAVALGMEDSDVAEYSYTVNPDGIREMTLNGTLRVWPVPVRDKLNVAAGGKTIRRVTVASLNGMVAVTADTADKTVAVDVHSLQPGIYIATILTEDGTYSCKILKTE